MDVTPTDGSPTWKLFGERVESLEKEFNTNEHTFHPITRENPIVTTTSFAKQSSVSQIADKDDPIFDFIDEIFWKELKGNDAKTQILEVAEHRAVSGQVNTYEAKQSEVLVSQQSEGGDGGGSYTYAYNLHWVSDPVFGQVAITAGVPVFTPDSGSF